MSQYIILIDKREEKLGIEVIRDANNNITIFDDISVAADVCLNHESCKSNLCEIVELEELDWSD